MHKEAPDSTKVRVSLHIRVLGAHDHCPHFGVNFCIQARSADEIHNPSLCIVIVHIQFFRKHPAHQQQTQFLNHRILEASTP